MFIVLPTCIADIILGRDFLSSTEAFIDCASRELHLNFSDTAEVAADGSLVTLVADTDILLPPYSAAVATLVPTLPTAATFSLIEPISTQLVTKGIIIPYLLDTLTSGKLQLWATNCSSEAQILPSGSRVATMHSTVHHQFASLLPTTSDALPTPPDFSKHVEKMIDRCLPLTQRHILASLLADYETLFEINPGKLPQTTLTEHRIDTGDSSPVRSRPYRVSPAERRVIQTHIDDMLQKQIIEPSSSPWSSPVVLVKK
ncbi:uncharacterized protein LOC115324420, partial [Ixodes scapularis]|uniref:uncharacterized protein LOC115324420 n=1 Tax=Ixodes scapularis TaxID=6945 RepID=UPI001A9CCFF4